MYYLLLVWIFIANSQLLPSVSNDKYFLDEYGRVRVFHGISRVTKEWPWYDALIDESFAKKLADFGFNAVRLGWMWTGFNPEENVFNETYFNIQREKVEILAKYGIYSLLDVHQDILSKQFCLYDGAPDWVINKTKGNVKHDFPWPLRGDCSRPWGENALAEATGVAYQSIFQNDFGCRDDFSKFWVESAKRWKNVNGILGYEIMNEPFAGDVYRDPLLFLPGEAGRKNLMPFYDAVSEEIRKVDDTHIIFYEPGTHSFSSLPNSIIVTWGMILNGEVLGSGLDHVPGGPKYANMSAFSYHYYCWSFVPDYPDHQKLEKLLCDDVLGPEIFKSAFSHTRTAGGTSMLTEFCMPDAEERTLEECGFVAGLADGYFESWTDWGFVSGEFTPSAKYTDVFSRTYARAIAGSPLNMTFEYRSDSKEFEMCFLPNVDIQHPTEIFYNPELYTRGVKIQVTDNLEVVRRAERVVEVSAKNGDVACVWIRNEK